MLKKEFIHTHLHSCTHFERTHTVHSVYTCLILYDISAYMTYFSLFVPHLSISLLSYLFVYICLHIYLPAYLSPCPSAQIPLHYVKSFSFCLLFYLAIYLFPYRSEEFHIYSVNSILTFVLVFVRLFSILRLFPVLLPCFYPERLDNPILRRDAGPRSGPAVSIFLDLAKSTKGRETRPAILAVALKLLRTTGMLLESW